MPPSWGVPPSLGGSVPLPLPMVLPVPLPLELPFPPEPLPLPRPVPLPVPLPLPEPSHAAPPPQDPGADELLLQATANESPLVTSTRREVQPREERRSIDSLYHP